MATRTAPARAVALAVALGGVLALGGLARAQPASPAPDDRAKASDATALYDEGKRHFDIGEYAQAIASWKQSYLRSSAPLLLFNIAQAYRLSGNCAQANRFYLNYRRVEQHPKNQTELDKAMARCAGIEPATGDASEPPALPTGGTAASPPGAAPTPAAVTVPGAPTTEPAPASPRTGAASAANDAAANRPTAAPPAASAGSIAASPSSEARRGTEPPVGSSGRGLRITGIVTGAFGVAALAAGGLYAVAASQDGDTVAGSRFGTQYTGDVASTDRSGKTAASRAQGLLGVGAALAVAGGVMWYVGHRRAAQVDVAIAPGHAEVALSCAF